MILSPPDGRFVDAVAAVAAVLDAAVAAAAPRQEGGARVSPQGRQRVSQSIFLNKVETHIVF